MSGSLPPNSPPTMFLTKDELEILTGRKTKTKQAEALRRMGIPFFVNACNAPVVTRVAVEGRPKEVAPPKSTWVPAVLREPDFTKVK